MKKTQSIHLFILFLLCFGYSVKAQSVDVYLTEDNIINYTSYDQTLNSGYLNLGWGGGWRNGSAAKIRAKFAQFSLNSSLKVSSQAIEFQLVSINGRTPGTKELEGTIPGYKVLNTNEEAFFQPKDWASEAEPGPIQMNYRISTSSLQQEAWVGGVYGNTIEHNQDQTFWNYYKYISPGQWTMNIHVPSFVKWRIGQNSFTKNYTSKSEFSSPSDLIFDMSDFQFVHTVNANLEIKSQGNIQFTPHGGGAATSLPISLVEAFGTNLSTKTLSTSYQKLNSSAYPVAVGNRTTVPLKLRIKSADIKQNFYKAGTYTFNADVRVISTNGSPSDVKSVSFTIVTSPFNTITVQGSSDVNFSFSSPSDYQLGKEQNIPNHLLVTNNKPFEIYVKSATANFTLNGTPTTIPASIVQLSNGSGQSGIITRNLSTTAQALMTGATPVLDQNVSLKYSIPAAQTSVLLGQTTGATPYLLNVIYSFTNQ